MLMGRGWAVGGGVGAGGLGAEGASSIHTAREPAALYIKNDQNVFFAEQMVAIHASNKQLTASDYVR